MCIWRQAEIQQLVESLLCEFSIADCDHDPCECCLKFISKINEKNKGEIEKISVYERLRKAEKKIAEGVDLPKAYFDHAEARAQLKDYSLAVQDYLFSIFLNPNDIKTYNWMIQHIGIGTDKYSKELIEIVGEMCRRCPDNPKSYGCRGFIRSKNGDLEGAIEDCNKALEMEENLWHYNVRGRCWIEKGKTAGFAGAV